MRRSEYAKVPRTLRGPLRVLPPGLRERYAEQWMGELRDASEIGLEPRDIVRGAWRFALLARFAAHGADALELERQSWVLARWGGALLAAGAIGATAAATNGPRLTCCAADEYDASGAFSASSASRSPAAPCCGSSRRQARLASGASASVIWRRSSRSRPPIT